MSKKGHKTLASSNDIFNMPQHLVIYYLTQRKNTKLIPSPSLISISIISLFKTDKNIFITKTTQL